MVDGKFLQVEFNSNEFKVMIVFCTVVILLTKRSSAILLMNKINFAMWLLQTFSGTTLTN